MTAAPARLSRKGRPGRPSPSQSPAHHTTRTPYAGPGSWIRWCHCHTHNLVHGLMPFPPHSSLVNSSYDPGAGAGPWNSPTAAVHAQPAASA